MLKLFNKVEIFWNQVGMEHKPTRYQKILLWILISVSFIVLVLMFDRLVLLLEKNINPLK